MICQNVSHATAFTVFLTVNIKNHYFRFLFKPQTHFAFIV